MIYKRNRFFKSELHITFRMFPSDPTGSLDAFSFLKLSTLENVFSSKVV